MAYYKFGPNESLNVLGISINNYSKYTAVITFCAITPTEKKNEKQTHSKFWWLEVLPSVKSTDCLTFSSFLEEVKDEIQNSLGRCCLYIQHFPKFIMFVAELASRVLNTIFLFSQLTQLEHTNRRNSSLFSLFL
jgi:hypothetical protein